MWVRCKLLVTRWYNLWRTNGRNRDWIQCGAEIPSLARGTKLLRPLNLVSPTQCLWGILRSYIGRALQQIRHVLQSIYSASGADNRSGSRHLTVGDLLRSSVNLLSDISKICLLQEKWISDWKKPPSPHPPPKKKNILEVWGTSVTAMTVGYYLQHC
jgi:hypothetical protein